jgi:4-hydroxybenzoate polyprenyltransferase
MTEVWITRLVPARAQAFARLARLDKPAGIWLLLWPCWWSVALASPHFPDWTLLILFAAGAAVMRAAGCVVNDVADKDFDAKVERTKNRPIASGAIDLRSAHIFLGALLLCGLAILLCFNRTAEIVGVASLPLIFVYPFTKRITHWPQAFLGLTFNWGALMGWAAVTGTLDWPAFLLYFSGIFWTLGYDTIYAHQDKEDDLLIGVRSTALKLGTRTRPYLFIFYGLGLAGMAAAGISAKLDPIFFAGLALGAGQLFWQAATAKLDDPADCLAKFRSNFWFGLIVFVGIVIARVTPFGI